MSKHTPAHGGPYLTFTLNQQLFGIPIETVREINQLPEITPIPQAPRAVAGVINLRDKVIPVVDLRRKFNWPEVERSRETCVIIVEGRQGLVAAIVDTVASVLALRDDQMESLPALLQTATSALVGLARSGQQVIILLDIRVLVDEDSIHEAYELPQLTSYSTS